MAALNEDFTWQRRGDVRGAVLDGGDGGCCGRRFGCPKSGTWRCIAGKAGLYLNQGYPLTLEEEFEFTLPAKAQPAALPGVSENNTAPLRWRVEWTKIGDDKLVARLRAELARGELTAAETPVLQKQLRELLAALAAGASLSAAP